MTIPTNEKGDVKTDGEKMPLLSSSFRKKSSTVSNHSVHFGEDSSRPVTVHLVRHASSFIEHFTKSEREKALKKPGVGKAAFLIRDAVLGSLEAENPTEGAYNPYENPDLEFKNAISTLCRRLCALRPMRRFMYAVVGMLVVVSFIEPPAWCFHIPGLDVDADMSTAGHCPIIMALHGPPADDPDSDKDVQYYPNSAAFLLTQYQATILEIACILMIGLFILIKIGRDGLSLTRYLRKGRTRKIRLFEITAVTLLALCSLVATVRRGYHTRFPAPILRIAILVLMSQGSRREVRTLVRLMPEIMMIIFLLFLVIFFYGFLGVVIFYGSEEGKMHFPNLVDATWTLWICVTTANYPDVMMPVYNESRVSAIYFVVFMIITFFFLMNVILASVVNAYDNELERRKISGKEISDKNLYEAFKILEHDGSIDRETVMALFLILNEDFPEVRRIPDDEAKLLFAFLDKDGSSLISEDEFMNFGSVMVLQFDRVDSYMTWVEKYFNTFYNSAGYQRFCNAIRSSKFDKGVDIILVLNAIVVTIQSYPILVGESVAFDPRMSNGVVDTLWEFLETLFTILYVLEFLVKWTVFGWKRYSESAKNLFDMAITLFAAFATIYVYYPNAYSDSRLIRYVIMVRVLRLLRLLFSLKAFQVIGGISAEIIPLAANVLLLLFCIMYVFAALGMYLFGGMISRDPSNPLSYLVLNTEFSDNEYWANNFNDMISSLNVLFNLLVVNNWTQCADGFEAVTQSKFTRLFYLAFHIFGVIVVNNVVIAFIVNSFIAQWDIQQEQVAAEEVEGEAVIEGRHALFDATHITGTSTSLTGKYLVRVGQMGRAEDQHELLKHLFTKTESRMCQGENQIEAGVSSNPS